MAAPVVEKAEEVAPESTRRRAKAQSQGLTTNIPSGFIISYSANGSKDIAENNVRMLRNKGFSAGYYYMPDKNASSPELYKVYVGPFSSESEALPDFKKVVAINDKAFIVRID